MEIKILGTGCAKCTTLEKITQEVIKEQSIEAKIIVVEDIMEIMKYGIMMTPALVINEEIVVKGKVPSKQEIIEIIKQKNA